MRDTLRSSMSELMQFANNETNQVSGLTALQETIDSVFDEMVCSTEDFINYLEDTEEEE